MAFERDSAHIQSLLQKALYDPEIAEGAKTAGLGENYLRSNIKLDPSQVWLAAQSQLDRFDALDGMRQQTEQQVKEQLPPVPWLVNYVNILNVVFGVLGTALASLTPIAYIISGFVVGWRVWPAWISSLVTNHWG